MLIIKDVKHLLYSSVLCSGRLVPNTLRHVFFQLDESLPSLSGMGIGCVRARVFPCEPIFRKPAGEVYLCSNWSDVYLILRLAPI